MNIQHSGTYYQLSLSWNENMYKNISAGCTLLEQPNGMEPRIFIFKKYQSYWLNQLGFWKFSTKAFYKSLYAVNKSCVSIVQTTPCSVFKYGKEL